MIANSGLEGVRWPNSRVLLKAAQQLSLAVKCLRWLSQTSVTPGLPKDKQEAVVKHGVKILHANGQTSCEAWLDPRPLREKSLVPNSRS